MLFYGLAVRALLFIFATLKTKASLDQVFLNHPQSIALLERLNSAAITSHEENEAIENVVIPGNDLGGPSQSFDTIACIFYTHMLQC